MPDTERSARQAAARAPMFDTPSGPMPLAEPEPERPSGGGRTLLRMLAIGLLCGLARALLPAYPIGGVELPPLSLPLGIAVSAAIARGRWMVPAALLGVLAGSLWDGTPWSGALAESAILAAQTLFAVAMLRSANDPRLLALDNWPRLKRLVLQAAPLTAALGLLLHVLADGLMSGAWPLPRALLAQAAARFVADSAGIAIVSAVLLCWLARPAATWRPRRRMLAAPLLLLLVLLLPGFHEVARRDDNRLAARFQGSVSDRLWRAQRLLVQPQDALTALRGALVVADAGGKPLPPAMFDVLAADWARRIPGLAMAGWIERGADGATAAGHAFRANPDSAPAAWPAALLKQWSKVAASEHVVALPAGGLGDAEPALVLAHTLPANAGQGPRVVFLLLRTGPLMASALPAPDDPNLVACLIDRDERGDATAAAKPAAAVAAPAGDEGTPVMRLAGPPRCESGGLGRLSRSASERVPFADRSLRLVVAEPASADDRLFTAVWLLALPALSGVALLGTLLLALSGRLSRIEDRVRERTVALSTEIEERRGAEARLAQSEQRFRAIFDSVSIGVTLVDMQGHLVAVNPAFCRMMACDAAHLLHKPLAEFRLPETAAEADGGDDDGTAAAVAGGQARRQRYMTADGRVLLVGASLHTLHDAQGQPVATVGALADLTPVLRLREAERERDEAAIANRTKSEFLARMSHELRAPLNAILGFAQMLGARTEADDPAAVQRGLEQIRQAGWHLLDMINDVLDLSRLEAGSLRLTLEPVSLTDIAQEAMAMVEPAAQQGEVRLDTSLSPLADRVQADPVRLRQVLINLLANAVRYNRHGGRVELRARPAGVGDVLVEVHDTGLGLSEAQMGELFVAFNRLGRDDRERPGKPEGTGIGLVICKRLVELMGGEISVTSTVGEGSVFSVRLQRATGEPKRVEVTSAPAMPAAVSIGQVLYIEDNATDTEVMRGLLKARPGIALRTARTAAEGLALAAEADLVLLDLDLPDRPGLSVLRQLRADNRLRQTPIVVVSGDTHPARIDECFEAGATDYLTKPLDAVPLLRAVDEALKAT